MEHGGVVKEVGKATGRPGPPSKTGNGTGTGLMGNSDGEKLVSRRICPAGSSL